MTASTTESTEVENAELEYPEPPEEVQQALQHADALSISLPATTAHTMLDTLRHVDEFLRCHAGSATQAELRAYCATQGWSPACSTSALIDRIGLHALALHHAITTAHHPGANTAGIPAGTGKEIA